MDRTRATSAPGSRRLIRSATTITAKTPAAMATDQPLMSPCWSITERTRSMVVVPRPGTPRTIGIWRTTISTAIPAKMPVITGVEKNSAIHPRRKRPTATSTRADQQGGERHRRAVTGGSHHGNRRHAGGEHRGDSRVCADRQVTVRTDQGVEHRPGDERVKTSHHRQVGQQSGGHLRRQSHRDQSQTRQRIKAQPRSAVAPQRRRDPPGAHASSRPPPAARS